MLQKLSQFERCCLNCRYSHEEPWGLLCWAEKEPPLVPPSSVCDRWKPNTKGNNVLVKDLLVLIKGDYPFILMLNDEKVAQGRHGEYAIRKEHWVIADNVTEIITKYGDYYVDDLAVSMSPPEFSSIPFIRIEILEAS